MAYFRRKKIIPNAELTLNTKNVKPIGILIPFNNPNGVFHQSYTNKDQVLSNLKNLLLTAKGERYMLPNFGTNIRTILFENISTEDEFFDLLTDEIRSSIIEWMPYVSVSRLTSKLIDDGTNESDHAIEIKLTVTISETNIYLPIQIFIDETGNLTIQEALNNG